ncbi:MAG: hypothetical protein Q9198_001915 [Flavoplaca austrocitrina]
MADFELDFLKGEDRVRGLHLHSACSRHGFSRYLAHFEHSEPSKDDGDDDDKSDEWSLTKLFTPDGVCIAEDIEIDKQAIIYDNPFEDDSPNHEESEGWLCNKDATCTEFYRESCLVIVPKQKHGSLLNRAGSPDSTVDEYAIASNGQWHPGRFHKDRLAQGKVKSTYGGLDSMVHVALKLEMPSLLASAMEKSTCHIGLEALREFTRALASRNPSPWLPA